MYRETEDTSILVVGINGKLLGIDRATGEVKWEDPLEGGGYGEVYIVWLRDVMFVSAGGKSVFCFRYPTGRKLWYAETSAPGRATMLVQGAHLFVAKGGEVECFTHDGAKLWTQALPGRSQDNITLALPGLVAQADNAGAR